MDDGWSASVQEVQTLEDLPTPVLQHLRVDPRKPPNVPARTTNVGLHKHMQHGPNMLDVAVAVAIAACQALNTIKR